MNPVISFCGVALLVLALSVQGGHHDVVDDEIWSHVFKVLSDTEHGKKVVASHPQPAHLVDAYTRVDSYHHEPFPYHDGHHHDHYAHPAPIVYHGHHHGHHHHHPPAHHVHAHPLPLHHGPTHYHHQQSHHAHHHHSSLYHHAPAHHHHHAPHHHHAHGPPRPVYRLPLPVPAVLDAYGPPHLHDHHKK